MCGELKCKLLVHITDGIWMSIILMIQGSVMNYYIIHHYSASVTPYFLFVADFLVLTTFIGTLITSYSYLRRVASMDPSDLSRSMKRVSLVGIFPLSYISWIFYIAVLITKILIIFESGLVQSLSGTDRFGPQILKVTMALAGLIFLLLLEGHNWDKKNSVRYSYVVTVCAKTGIEIFDSIEMLAILMDGPKDLSTYFRNFILGMSVLNLFLPAIKLYQLSFPDQTIDKRSSVISVVYYACHVVLVDVPFLAVRIYLWVAFRMVSSMFLMKNILSLVLTLRGMYPDLLILTKEYILSSPTYGRSLRYRTAKTVESRFEEVSLTDKEKPVAL